MVDTLLTVKIGKYWCLLAGPMRVNHDRSIQFAPLFFISPTLVFPTLILLFLCLYGIWGHSKWPADLRATLAPLVPMGPSRARGSRSTVFLKEPVWAVRSTGLTSRHRRAAGNDRLRFVRSSAFACWPDLCQEKDFFSKYCEIFF